MKRISFFLICLIVSLQIQAQGSFNCFSVLAGKKATVDGSVLFAHNEDDYGDVYFNIYMVPGTSATINGSIAHESAGFEAGASDQADGNCRYLWLEMPGMHFSDSYMNEFGVVIASDACPSREDQPELTGGGITWELRNTMARQARSARHAVEIAKALIEERGYNSSGRTYCIADPNEAWMLSVVNGKRFVAKRIPDDAVAVIPNYYTITDVDLTDRENVIASPDLIIYAEKRGWYNPVEEKSFSFRKAYGSRESLMHMVNIGRMWAGYNILSGREAGLKDEFPWVFRPSAPLSVEILIELLANHYEGTELDATRNMPQSDPHLAQGGTICAEHTRYGFVAHLQGRHPIPLGCVMWLAPYRPCTQPFFPLNAAMTESPKGFYHENWEYATENHFNAPSPARDATPGHAYWRFFDYTNRINENYPDYAPFASSKAKEITRAAIAGYHAVVQEAAKIFQSDPHAAIEFITRYAHEQAYRANELQDEQPVAGKPIYSKDPKQ